MQLAYSAIKVISHVEMGIARDRALTPSMGRTLDLFFTVEMGKARDRALTQLPFKSSPKFHVVEMGIVR